jgi:hypothetical protein
MFTFPWEDSRTEFVSRTTGSITGTGTFEPRLWLIAILFGVGMELSPPNFLLGDFAPQRLAHGSAHQCAIGQHEPAGSRLEFVQHAAREARFLGKQLRRMFLADGRREELPRRCVVGRRWRRQGQAAQISNTEMTRTARLHPLDRNPLHLVEGHLAAPAIVELGGAGRGVVCHHGGGLQRAAVFQIGGDAGRPEGVIADLRLDAGGGGAPARAMAYDTDT